MKLNLATILTEYIKYLQLRDGNVVIKKDDPTFVRDALAWYEKIKKEQE